MLFPSIDTTNHTIDTYLLSNIPPLQLILIIINYCDTYADLYLDKYATGQLSL